MTPNTFVHRGDLVNEINKLGTLYDIKDEMIDNPQVFMLCCTNINEKCEAKILGLYSQKDKHFHIKRIDSIHTCSKNTKKEAALFAEMQKYPEIKRTGELVEKISAKFKVSYYDVFKAQHKGNLSLEFFDKENLRNTGNMFLSELGYSAERDLMNFQKTEDLKLECLLALKQEAMEMNSNLKSACNRNNFFMKNIQMSKVLRKVTELKIYPRQNGTLILGLLFDPCDEHIIQTFLVSEDSKLKALETFVDYDKQTTSENEVNRSQSDSIDLSLDHKIKQRKIDNLESINQTVTGEHESINSTMLNTPPTKERINDIPQDDTPSEIPNNQVSSNPFYIIDFDYEVIQFFISKNIPFFIKSRAVSMYLQDSKDEDPYALDYFNILNYGDKELLDLDKSLYLKRFCPFNIYNLNNGQYPDFEFITNHILSLPLIDCAISLLWLISDDLRNKKFIGNEELENRFPETIQSYFEDFNEAEPLEKLNCDLEQCYCECGKFQENLFPCIHAYYKIKELGKDPFFYVSSIYSKDNFLKIQEIKPVVNLKVHPNKFKSNSKKKKTDQNESDE